MTSITIRTILPPMNHALALMLLLLPVLSLHAEDAATVFSRAEEARLKGDTAGAEKLFAKSADAFLADGNRQNWARASYMREQMLNSLGRFTDALTLMNAVVAEFDRINPGGSVEYAQALADRGALLGNMGRHPEEEASARQAVAMIERVRPGDAIHIRALSVLGRALTSQDKVYEALKMEEQAVSWARQRGVPASTLASSLESAGAGAISAGKYDLAVEHLTEAVTLTLSDYSESHPITATRRYKLGWAKMRAGDLNGAEEALTRAYADEVKSLGPEAAITAGTLALTGELRRRQRRLDAALLAEESALKIAEKLGNDNFLGEVEEELGAIYRELGRFADASTHFVRGAKRLKGLALGELRREEALLHEAAGRKDAAAATLKEALTLMMPLGDSHPKVVEMRRDYARVGQPGGARVERR